MRDPHREQQQAAVNLERGARETSVPQRITGHQGGGEECAAKLETRLEGEKERDRRERCLSECAHMGLYKFVFFLVLRVERASHVCYSSTCH